MIDKLNIINAYSRKACCIIFILFISISFSIGGAQAKSCKGGPDCANCAGPAHPHAPGAQAGMENNGCRPGDKNGTCGFEDDRSPDEFHGFALATRSENHNFSGIFNAVSDEYVLSHLFLEVPLPFHSPSGGGTTPIYLINRSLRC
jgi:hypothetical protein